MNRTYSKRLIAVWGALVVCASVQTLSADTAADIINKTGVKGGFVVHLGCGDGKLTAALRRNESYLVHGLDTDVDTVRRARKHIESLGVYGKVSVDGFDGKKLPYVRDIVNLLVASDLGKITMDEVRRKIGVR